MAALGTGHATPEKRKARAILRLREPHVEKLLTGLNLTEDMAEARRFCKSLTVERSRWDIERRRVGLFSGRRLSKSDADAALKRALVALEGGAI